MCDSSDNTRNVNLSFSAMYSGKIDAIGPRYCPSIEDKIVRFSDRDSHQLFLEPEWVGSNQIYLNGFSTSMPKNVQIKALQTISALRGVKLIRPGYAIESDYFPTYQLKSTLESKNISGIKGSTSLLVISFAITLKSSIDLHSILNLSAIGATDSISSICKLIAGKPIIFACKLVVQPR